MRPALLFFPLSEVQLIELPVIGFVSLTCEPVFGCPDHLPRRVEASGLQDERDAHVERYELRREAQRHMDAEHGQQEAEGRVQDAADFGQPPEGGVGQPVGQQGEGQDHPGQQPRGGPVGDEAGEVPGERRDGKAEREGFPRPGLFCHPAVELHEAGPAAPLRQRQEGCGDCHQTVDDDGDRSHGSVGFIVVVRLSC